MATFKRGDLRVDVHYMKTYRAVGLPEERYGSYTDEKTPKITLEVFGLDEEIPRIGLFEPVYDPSYSELDFKVRDVQRMHVYRDAIVEYSAGKRPKRRIVEKACILHPSDEAFRLYAGMSAIPLTPERETVELREELEEILA